MKRCTRCVLPDTVPGITFDLDGVCSFCQSYTPRAPRGEAALLERIAAAKRDDGRYDCIVPLSGGRDSSFVLYMAAERYRLRVLAVTYDNEFRVPQAEQNVDTACRILGVDHVRIRSRHDVARKMVYQGMRMAVPFGFRTTQVPWLCGACSYGFHSVVYRAAEQHRVPLILWGDSDEENTLPMHARVERADTRPGRDPEEMRRRRHSTAAIYLFRYYGLLQRAEFPVRGNHLLGRDDPRLTTPGIQEIHFFDYVPWDRNVIKEAITQRLGWRKPDDHPSSWRFDCVLHLVINYYHLLNFGCTKDCFGYARMINSGRMSRQEALEQEEAVTAHLAEHIRGVLQDHVGLSARDVDRLAQKDGVTL